MKPAAFRYHAPADAAEAVWLLAELGEDAKPIAGGQSLVPMLNLRLAVFAHLVDLRRITSLSGITRRDDAVWIGAGTTQATIQRSAEINTAVPLLARATPLIGHFQIRNRGTIGGSLAHADAAAEYPAVAVTLDAEFEAKSVRGTRTIPAAEFFTGMWSTALAQDELLTGVTFPLWQGSRGFAIEEFARRHGDFAIAGATVALELAADQTVSRCAIALFGMGHTAFRATTAEKAFTGARARDIRPDEVGATALTAATSIPEDLHGTADYRRQVGGAMVARAWRRAVEEAAG